MSDVVKLQVVQTVPEPDGEIIAVIEDLLARAKSGDLQAIAYCTVSDDGVVGTGWAGTDGTRHPLGMAVSILSVRYPTAVMRHE